MASGDVVGILAAEVPPAASYAQFDTRPGGSTPAEAVPVWDFDDTSDEYIDIPGRLSGYDGGGLTVSWPVLMTSATSGNIRVGAAFRRLDTGEDVDAAHTYDFNEATVAVPATSGAPVIASIAFTAGADMDSLADGEAFILRLRREPSDTTNDTATGDAEFLLAGLLVKET